MRLWHKYLIPVLPRMQLLGQVRELTSIIKDIKEKGRVNHILINKIEAFPLSHLYTYCVLIENEMHVRGYNLTKNTKDKWMSLFNCQNIKTIPLNELFKGWHDETYIKICYYNLLEKYLCGGITKEDFEKLKDKVEKCLY